MQQAPEVFMALVALLQHAEALRHEGMSIVASRGTTGNGRDRVGDHAGRGWCGYGGKLWQRNRRRRG